ncbi:terminal flower 1-like protein-like protein [Sporormia fimetaria CBS 119925]|uniref:Terminal flower 1-like protein-like protein n=1 Tax=Sporormia fimetaria CBS 119925 TaxID=1340428 RepID=A0A6A6VL38_9PLEO|nr:terminal flower 1-like protein-like protein [Sporormia fimetaria CBS 119925]
MRVQAPLIAALQLWGLTVALPADQTPLQDAIPRSLLAVRHELLKAEIIPTVIDDFLPSLSLAVSWPKRKADLGNTIKPKHLQDQPSITLNDETNQGGCPTTNMTYVVTLTDPDAPSRDDPKWSEMCHWIVSNVSLSEKTFSILPVPFLSAQEKDVVYDAGLDEIMEWKPPGPPPKTGKHRYVFLVFAPGNGTSLPLRLSKPKERQHWGTGKKGGGVRDWAKENGLVPVGANFVYSKNKKQ